MLTLVSCVTFGIGFLKLSFPNFRDYVNQAMVCSEMNLQVEF